MMLHPDWADLPSADAARAAAFVFADPAALGAWEIGETQYPDNVEAELDRLRVRRYHRDRAEDDRADWRRLLTTRRALRALNKD